jgi:hypothetical protein
MNQLQVSPASFFQSRAIASLGEFTLSEALRDIIRQEQDLEIDLKDALGLR